MSCALYLPPPVDVDAEPFLLAGVKQPPVLIAAFASTLIFGAVSRVADAWNCQLLISASTYITAYTWTPPVCA